MFIKSSPLDCEIISFAHVLFHHFKLCLHACVLLPMKLISGFEAGGVAAGFQVLSCVKNS